MIEQELKFIRNYIAFQKVRMPETFHLSVRFDPQLNVQPIHPLLLFPLVENAYKYVGGDYWIKIEALLKKGGLSFTVENSIPEIAQITKNKNFGIGLENLQRRLNLLYPDKYTFETKKKDNSYITNLRIEW
jgi:sensor histidine kinase YesM